MALSESNVDGPERDRRIDRLYPHTGLEEPRAELDGAIRAAARREVGARPQVLGARLRRWQLPISIAAVVVISASMVILMRDEGVDRLEEAFAPEAMREKAAPLTPHQEDADLKPKERADAPARTEAPASKRPPAPAVAVPSSAAEEAQRAMRPDAPPAGRSSSAKPFPGEMRQRGAAVDEAASAPALPTEPARRSEPAAAGILSAPAPSTEDKVAELEGRKLSKRAQPKSEHSLFEDRVSALIDRLKEAPPEKWIDEIDVLRRQGRNEEADRLLAEFRRRFPHHAVPEHWGEPGN